MKADYKTMILSNQKLFDFLNQEFDILPTESDMNEIKIICKQIESEESKPPFDRNNFCVDIQKEKDSPLLEGFKEWYKKASRDRHLFKVDVIYYGIKNGQWFNNDGDDFWKAPIITLSELYILMPEIWGDSFYCKTFTVYNKTSGTIEAQPTSSEKWEPEWGKEYEFSQDGEKWERGLFIAMNPRYKDDYLYMSKTTDFILGGKYIRPVKTLRDEVIETIESLNDDDGEVDRVADRILALIEQRRGGRDDY